MLAGPYARDVLAKLTDQDLSNQGFPWLSGRHIRVGLASGVRAMRGPTSSASWAGSCTTPIEYQNHSDDAIIGGGGGVCHRPGSACGRWTAMRLEKSYRGWGTELNREYSAWEAGLHRFVRTDKGDFFGRDALIRQRRRACRRATSRCWSTARAWTRSATSRSTPRTARWSAGPPSGGHSYMFGKGISLGFVKPEWAASVRGWRSRCCRSGLPPAEVVVESPYDPDNERLRADIGSTTFQGGGWPAPPSDGTVGPGPVAGPAALPPAVPPPDRGIARAMKILVPGQARARRLCPSPSQGGRQPGVDLANAKMSMNPFCEIAGRGRRSA